MVDIDFLTKKYFVFDKPVDFQLKNGKINISPIMLSDSEVFGGSYGILTIDKNSIPDPKIIQMSYLKFIVFVLFGLEDNIIRFTNLLLLCLGLKNPKIIIENNNPVILDETLQVKITHKEFEDIRKIILYQNIVGYDDEYVNPEFQKALDEVDELKNKSMEPPSLERRIGIITSHTGLSKKEQMEMTLRSHSVLFREVVEEIRYNVIMPVAVYNGKFGELDNWIYKKKKGKFDDYVTNVESYTESFGGSQAVKTTNTAFGDSMDSMFNEFIKK